jgi:SAM-dependent methyltransferase
VNGPNDDPDILAEQAAYYRARAPEYDRWFRREGRYDRGPQETARWFGELAEVRAALTGVPIDGADVVELAPGTGLWTELLVDRAARVTAVDASPEMVEQARRRLGERAGNVNFVVADLFRWRPPRTFDAAVFCFWISHVPDELLDGFLAGVASMLRPGGAVFFVDGRREPLSTAADHALPPAGEEVMERHLDDGRRFRIVKAFRDPEALEACCRRAGLDVAVRETATYFQFGAGSRR